MPSQAVKRINRLLRFCERFIECINQVGLYNAVTIFSFVIPGPDEKKCIRINGRRFFFFPKSDKGVLTHLYKPGYRINGDVRLIFDIGANIGDETLRFRCFHPVARIVAVEASSRNHALLRENFSEDGNIDLVHGALWCSTSPVSLSSGPNFEAYHVGGSRSEPYPGQSSQVVTQGYSVSDLLEKLDLSGRRIDVFKIDVEGAEEFIFTKGDTRWLDLVNVIVMEIPDCERLGSFQKIISHFIGMNIWGNSYVSGENYVFIRQGCQFELDEVIGLGR